MSKEKRLNKGRLESFEGIVKKHSLMPGNKLYNAVGFTGEAGEVVNVLKKMAIREQLSPEELEFPKRMRSMDDYRKMLNEELGDALFYLTRVALDNNLNLSTIMEGQAVKLSEQDEQYSKTFKK